MDDRLLREQKEYYRARAPEYDEWFFRQGRYDRGPELNARWFAEVDEVRKALDNFAPRGDVLELACGTGLWTERLLPFADRITALDSSPEVIDINRKRLGSDRVAYLCGDIFAWKPDRRYDAVVFAFFLSHVPNDRFIGFWDSVKEALSPGGRVFFVDSRREPTSTAVDHVLPADQETALRRLNDGREFQVVKVFYHPADLAARLRGMGWDFAIRETADYFLYGEGKRS